MKKLLQTVTEFCYNPEDLFVVNNFPVVLHAVLLLLLLPHLLISHPLPAPPIPPPPPLPSPAPPPPPPAPLPHFSLPLQLSEAHHDTAVSQ